jgi:hypothetical protein
MNIRGFAVAIALSICASGCVRGRKANLAPSARLVKKASEVLRGLLVLRDLLAHRDLRARKVLLARQVLPRTPFELYVSTARAQRAEGSATKMRYL